MRNRFRGKFAWRSQLLLSLWITGVTIIAQPAQADVATEATKIPHLKEFNHPATTVKEWLSQSPTPIQVTGVQINKTEAGIEVILQTAAGATLQPVTRSESNRYIADIKNAQLGLPSGDTFRQDNPVAGITLVTVTNQDANSIRLTVTGLSGVPTVELFDSDEGLIFGITAAEADMEALESPQTPATPEGVEPRSETEPPETSAEGADDLQETPDVVEPGSETEPDETSAQEDEPIEILVTGEQETGYSVPSATTGTRTDTPIRDIPQSIQVVPRQVIEDQGVTRVSDITRNVSGVVATTGPSGVGEQFTIRGFGGNDSAGAGNEYRNGFRTLDLGSFNSSNIERVEVLKGPASVLYGQIEPGGVINFVTKQPLDRPYYSGELEIGSYAFYKPSLDISGPLTQDERLLYRFNIAYENSDSFVDFVDREIFQISPSFTYEIGDNTKLSLSYEYLSENGTNNPGLPRNPIAFDLPRNLFLGEPGDTVDNEAQSLNLDLEHRFSENWQLRSRFAWQSSSFKREAHRIGRNPEEDGTLDRFFQSDLANRNEGYSIQTDLIGKLKTGSIDHQLLFGVEWLRYDLLDDTGFATVDSINIFDPIYGSPRPTVLDQGASTFSSSSDSIGLYVQDQVTLLPNLKLLVGGRYEFIDESSQFQDLDVDGTTPIGEVIEDSFSNEAFSPRVGIVYQPIEPVSLYASYSRSFVPNNVFTITGELIEPTRGTQFEAGVKAEFLDGRLSATLAAYQITKTNVASLDPNDLNEEASIAIGKIRSRGIEFDLAGEPLPGWNIIASLFFNESVVRVGDPDNSPVGDTLINAPASGASLWTTYEIQTGDMKGLGFGVGVFYVGDTQAELPNTFVIPSYVRADAAIFYKRTNWRAGLNFKNLFDTTYYTSQGAAIYPGDPFTVLGSVSVEF